MPAELTAEEFKALQDAKPFWQKNGLRDDVIKISNTKANLIWDSKVNYRRPELNIQTT